MRSSPQDSSRQAKRTCARSVWSLALKTSPDFSRAHIARPLEKRGLHHPYCIVNDSLLASCYTEHFEFLFDSPHTRIISMAQEERSKPMCRCCLLILTNDSPVSDILLDVTTPGLEYKLLWTNGARSQKIHSTQWYFTNQLNKINILPPLFDLNRRTEFFIR